jgi:SAM-dependent methyltransferase
MTIEQAIEKLRAEYPFKDYEFSTGVGAHRTVAEVVTRNLPAGAKILDFGAGACDKTAMLSYLGYMMFACDDFGDDWHAIPGKREGIFDFAKRSGIELSVVDEKTPWPWQRGEFDMVMLQDVLEHLHDSPRGLLTALIELIRPGGFLFVTVPNAGNLRKRLSLFLGGTNLPPYHTFYYSKGPWRGHVREYVRGDLESLCSFLNLQKVELRGCSHMLQKVPKKILPLWMAATAVCPSWRDCWYLIARKPEGWKLPEPPK